MTLQKVRYFLENYICEDGIGLTGYFDFVERKGRLYIYQIDGGEAPDSRFFRVGLFYILHVDNYKYFLEERHQSRPKSKGKLYRMESRKEIAKMLESIAEV